MERLIDFTLFWGVWLLVPMLIDGITTLNCVIDWLMRFLSS